MTRYLPWVFAGLVALVAISFGVRDHTWIEPGVLIVFAAAVAWVTAGRRGR